jgi:hypothetical protein
MYLFIGTVAAIFVGVWLLSDYEESQGDPTIIDQLKDAVIMLTGPTTLLPDGTVSIDGVNPADPQALATAANWDIDTYSLARMIRSEAGGQKLIAQQAVGSVALNHARDTGQTITEVLLRATRAGNGYYGRQDQGRYASTSRDPADSYLQLASDLISGVITDPTNGARQWDSPNAYADASKADTVAATRIAAGNEKVLLPGVPEATFRFWRPV